MASDKPAISPKVAEDLENPEWTEADFRRALPARELPPEVAAAFPKTRVRGPQKAPTKRPTSLRLDPEVLDYWKATGDGWQTRINAVLRQEMDRRRS